MIEQDKVFEELRKPFPLKDLEWRVMRSGYNNNGEWAMVLCYVTNRAIMDRLDVVCQPQNWQNVYTAGPDGGVVCGLGLRYLVPVEEDKFVSEWLWKYDGAPNTDIESVKGGLSDSMKRAAVQWGIGRYLYHLESNFAKISQNGKYKAKTKDNSGKDIWFKWDPPDLPNWALPSEDQPKDKNRIEEGKMKLSQLLEDNRALLSDTFVDACRVDMENVKTEADIETLWRETDKAVKATQKKEIKEEAIF